MKQAEALTTLRDVIKTADARIFFFTATPTMKSATGRYDELETVVRGADNMEPAVFSYHGEGKDYFPSVVEPDAAAESISGNVPYVKLQLVKAELSGVTMKKAVTKIVRDIPLDKVEIRETRQDAEAKLREEYEEKAVDKGYDKDIAYRRKKPRETFPLS